MNDVIIRPYRPEDEERVVDLWLRCNLVVPHNNPRLDIQRKLRVNPEWFLVGVSGDRIIASCMIGYEGHRGWINYMAVSPTHQRRGVATSLMRRAETILAAAGCAKINLQIRALNREAMRFYESIGYSEDAVFSMGKRLVRDDP